MAVKKTTKKAAKKTFPSTKKKLPNLKKKSGESFASVKELVKSLAENQAKLTENHTKLADNLAEKLAESQARLTERQAKLAEKQDKWAENLIERLTEKLAESHAKTEAAIAKSREETDKALQRLSDHIGHIGNDIGELMEFIVIPKIRFAMNATGKHMFKTMETERKFKEIDELGEKKIFTEVDVLLYGETEVMAVETKSHLFTRDVKKHKERLELLRRHEDVVGIEGKKLVGAVVGAVVDEGAKKFALESGLYVVKIREEAEKLDVEEPETCRAW